MRDLLFATLVLATASAATAQPLPAARPDTVGMSSERLGRIAEAMRREIAENRTPGAVIAIARRGKLVYHEAFGMIDGASRTPMRRDAVFQIASMTKPLVTVGALLLHEEGRLLLNEPIGTYVPELAGMQVAVLSADRTRIERTEPPRRAPTVQDLMRHTARGWTWGFGARPSCTSATLRSLQPAIPR